MEPKMNLYGEDEHPAWSRLTDDQEIRNALRSELFKKRGITWLLEEPTGEASGKGGGDGAACRHRVASNNVR
jgi:hypothetical protein